MSDTYKEITRRLHELEWLRHYVVHHALKDSEVYFGQPPILDYLMQNGTCTQSALAKALNVSAPSMAVSLRRMQKSGLIEKVADATDLRCNQISLTEKGRMQREKVHSSFDQIDAQLYAGFSDEELTQLSGLLDRLYNNLSTELPRGTGIMELIQKELCNGGDANNGQTD